MMDEEELCIDWLCNDTRYPLYRGFRHFHLSLITTINSNTMMFTDAFDWQKLESPFHHTLVGIQCKMVGKDSLGISASSHMLAGV